MQTSPVKSKTDTRDPRALEAARMFEQEFLGHLVKEMRKTVTEDDDIIPTGMGGKIFKEELDTKYVEGWVNDNGGIGLADLIYDQVQDKVRQMHARGEKAKEPGEFLPMPHPTKSGGSLRREEVQDILLPQDAERFLARKSDGPDQGGVRVDMRAKQPLDEPISLRAPISGTVLQASTLEDGQQAIVVEHSSLGLKLVSTLIHSGKNKVRPGQQIFQGAPLAELPASTQGELAKAQFTLKSSPSPSSN